MTAAEIQAWLVARIAELRGLPASEIDARTPLAAYGLDSAEAAVLVADLETWLGRDLPPALAWEHPTVQAMAAVLADPRARGDDPADTGGAGR